MAEAEDLGTLINERRLALGFSLGQLASRVGATPAEVRGWEKAGGVPPVDTLPKLGSVLGVAPERLAAARGQSTQGRPVRTSPAAKPPAADAAATGRTRAKPDGRESPAQGDRPAASPTDEPTSMVSATHRGDTAEPTPAEAAAAAMVFSDDSATAGTVDAEKTSSGDPEAPPAASGGASADVSGEARPSASSEARTAPPGEPRIEEVPTESVAVVEGGNSIPGGVAVPPPPVRATSQAAVATQAPPRVWPDATPDTTPRHGLFGPINDFFATIFDPERRYLFWIRLVLTVVALLIFARILIGVVPAFLDTLSEILDTIESTTDVTTVPGELPTDTTLPSG